VTNDHVAEGATEVEVVFANGDRRAGTVVGTDAFSDLAVIRVDEMPAFARPLPLTTSFDALKVGQPVVAIGNPFGLNSTMTYGIISALGRVIESQTQFSIPQAIQTDAAINPGNSGGPLLDLRGQVIGVNAQISTTNFGSGGTPGNSGVGFAIPSAIVARVAPAIIRDGRYEWSYLGVHGTRVITLDMVEANGLADAHGAYILAVEESGPSAGKLEGATNAAQAAPLPQTDENGLQVLPVQPGGASQTPVGGDVIVAVDGQPVGSFDDLLTYVALETAPGQSIELTVLRDGREIPVSITVGERPGAPGTR